MAVALTSHLPCHWLAQQVAIYYLPTLNSRYEKWLKGWTDNYDDNLNATKSVAEMKKWVNELAKIVPASTRERMHEVFRESLELEYIFWQKNCDEVENWDMN